MSESSEVSMSEATKQDWELARERVLAMVIARPRQWVGWRDSMRSYSRSRPPVASGGRRGALRLSLVEEGWKIESGADCIGAGDTEAAAWLDAASRLPSVPAPVDALEAKVAALEAENARLRVENDVLQQHNRSSRNKLQQIADQYAVDCL